MSRISLQDNTMSAIMKMADGNPGAIDAMMQMLLSGNDIDSNNTLGGFGNILLLDTFRIYGTDIYVLFNDICGRNIAKMIAVIKASQMGLFDCNLLKEACSRQDYSGRELIPVDELYKKFKERLPKFNINNNQ